jgi:hypothetical protein
MSRAFLGPALLEAGLLGVLADWLRPLPRDGAPPPQGVKKAVFVGLLRMHVDWADPASLNALKRSNLGRLVLAASKDREAPAEVSRAAEKLVELWSRPVFNISDDLKMMPEIDMKRGHQISAAPSAKSLLAAQQQAEIQQRIQQSRKKPNTRAQLPYAVSDELGGAVVRPKPKPQQHDRDEAGHLRRVSENAAALMAGIQMFDEVAREISKTKK